MENPFEIINKRLDRIEFLLENIYSGFQKNNTIVSYPDLMDIKQLTQYLNVSKSYIYKMTSLNNIPHSKNGKKLYFDRKKITTWVLENKIFTNEEIDKKASEYLFKKVN